MHSTPGVAGIPAFLDNDANLAALGEWIYGVGRGQQHFLYLSVSTGIGVGIIVDGQLLRGYRSSALQAGHMIVEPGGRCVHVANEDTWRHWPREQRWRRLQQQPAPKSNRA